MTSLRGSMSPVYGIYFRKFFFRTLFGLCLLKLSGCDSAYVPANIYKNFEKSYKSIKCDQSEIKRILNLNDLKELHVSFCNLSKVEAGFFWPPKRSLSVLEIEYSNVIQLEKDALTGLRNLKRLSLSRNSIEEVKSWSNGTLNALIALDLSQNLIRELTLQSFRQFPNLQSLNLEGNRLAYLSGNIFASLTFLKHLNLGANRLKAINGNSLNDMHRLTELWLHSNEIASIALDAFKANEHLKLLHLQDNRLESMRFLNQSRQLTHLNLSFNHFIEITPQAIYARFNELIDLDLSHNRIVELANDSFYGLKSLEKLDLSHNYLHTVTSRHFIGLSVLQELNLSFNRIKRLASDLFRNMTLLHSVDLSNNKLLKIPGSLFDGMPYLAIINLCGNQLDDLEFLASLAPELRRDELTLDLSSNHFGVSLNLSVLEGLSSAQLAGNYWPCTWLIAEAVRLASPRLHFGHNYSALSAWSMEILNLSTVECFDDANKLRTVILEAPTSCELQMTNNCAGRGVHEVSEDSASPPTLVWPRLRADKFDSRSVILWMLTAIAIAFGALRIARQIIDRKEQQRLSRQWREKKVHQDGMELVSLEGKLQKRVTICEDLEIMNGITK